jgi:4-hydroxybenzoate polyprenyltransferase
VLQERRTAVRLTAGVLRSAHIGPALVVTLIAGLLASVADLSVGRSTLVVAAVLTGQLSIGWSNDLIDVRRDREAGRTDKPLARGEVPVGLVRVLCGTALVGSLPLSFACGLEAGLVNVACTAAGWVYNLGVKATVWSWLPYAVAFGGLPAFVSLAEQPPLAPPAWAVLAGALLGVGAHLVNALPDLADDLATGVRGLPQRIGVRWTGPLAIVVLVAASVLIAVAGPITGSGGGWVVRVGLALVLALAVLALLTRGRTPFRAAMGIALVDVVMLVASR